MKTTSSLLGCLAIVALLSGCVGFTNTLFVTKTNVGFDFDSKPPTLEVSVARREGAIAPSFEGGQSPPVMASFVTEPGRHVPLFPRISQTFAGGDAALIMAHLYDSNTPVSIDKTNYDSRLWLSEVPRPVVVGKLVSFPKPGKVRPFLFGTDTSFGLKAGWSGLTGQFPDTVKLGLNRKEFALAPVFMSPIETNRHGPNIPIKMPSFLATLDNSTRLSSPTNSQVEHVQYFATGSAAEKLAVQAEVRRTIIKRLDPRFPTSGSQSNSVARSIADHFAGNSDHN